MTELYMLSLEISVYVTDPKRILDIVSAWPGNNTEKSIDPILSSKQ